MTIEQSVKDANRRSRTARILLRCPFCACDAYFRHFPGYDSITVKCAGTDCEAEIGGFTTVEEAIAAWSLRRTEPKEEDVWKEQATAL